MKRFQDLQEGDFVYQAKIGCRVWVTERCIKEIEYHKKKTHIVLESLNNNATTHYMYCPRNEDTSLKANKVVRIGRCSMAMEDDNARIFTTKEEMNKWILKFLSTRIEVSKQNVERANKLFADAVKLYEKALKEYSPTEN